MEELEDMVEIRCQDYRDIDEKNKFDKISSIEMAEHVGIANFQIYLNKIKNILSDDGMFLMQVAGLRQVSLCLCLWDSFSLYPTTSYRLSHTHTTHTHTLLATTTPF